MYSFIYRAWPGTRLSRKKNVPRKKKCSTLAQTACQLHFFFHLARKMSEKIIKKKLVRGRISVTLWGMENNIAVNHYKAMSEFNMKLADKYARKSGELQAALSCLSLYRDIPGVQITNVDAFSKFLDERIAQIEKNHSEKV